MLAERYDALLFDLDGVLYRGDDAGAPRRRGDGRAPVDRDPARLPDEQLLPHARAGGREAHAASASRRDPSEVVTSALATADLLAARGGGTAFVVGQDGVREALADVGIRILDGEPERVDHVVVGVDLEATYTKLRIACELVQRGAHLVATNPDRSFPAPGALWPGAGALLAVITETTGAERRGGRQAVRAAVRGGPPPRGRGRAAGDRRPARHRHRRRRRRSAGTPCSC